MDAIKDIQMLSGIDGANIFYDADVVIGSKIGIEDAIYVMQVIGEIRGQLHLSTTK